MILIIDEKFIFYKIACMLSHTYNITYYNKNNHEYTNSKIYHITNLKDITKYPNYVIIVHNCNIIIEIYKILPKSHIIFVLGDIYCNIPCNIDHTIVCNIKNTFKEDLYKKTHNLLNVEYVFYDKKWLELLSTIDFRLNSDLTPISPFNIMKILLIKKTRLANAPDELAFALNKYTNVICDIDCIPKPGYDILHFNNIYIPCKHKNKLIQYHSEPTRVTFSKHFQEFPKIELVLSQYHATLPEYKHCKIVRNIINFENDAYNVIANNVDINKIKIGFSPSTTQKVNEFYNKGYEETKEILEKLKDVIEYDIITGVSLSECLYRKSQCDIIIDECVTGSFHRSGLEGLALGKMTICYINEETLKILKNSSKSNTIPFENVHIDKLYSYLLTCSKLPISFFNEKGKKNRAWMEKYWHPRDIAFEFVEIYKKMIL